MMAIMIVAIGILAFYVDRHTGGHLRRMSFVQLFLVFFMFFLILSMIGGSLT
jgi:hypothetical protein